MVIIGCFFTVLNTLGGRVLEKVYENALAFELETTRLTSRLELPKLSNTQRCNPVALR
jgi:hypothetical protein